MNEAELQSWYQSLPLERLGRCVVFGGTGFIGRRVASRLAAAGVPVVVASRHQPPEGVLPAGVQWLPGDIRDLDAVRRACAGAQTVFHTASSTEMSGKWSFFYQCNVVGSRNICAVCRELGVPRLVYTSTPSVVTGAGDIIDGDESLPYHASGLSNYARSKQMAEQEMLAANCNDMAVTALRPHLVWGPDDPHILPVLAAAHRRHKLRRIGDGSNIVSLTHVENAAYGHIAAALELAGERRCAGKAYFICDQQPVRLWEWIDGYLRRIGLPPLERAVSAKVMYCLAALAECATRIIPGLPSPQVTRFVVRQVSTSHSFLSDAARRDFGYRQLVSNEEGLAGLDAATILKH